MNATCWIWSRVKVRIASRSGSNGCCVQSRIPAEKALANFNLKRLPPKVALLTKSLIEGEVLDRRDNVLAFGNPGSGKTHLLCAIGQELIARGRRIYFTSAALLVQDLLVAKRDLKLSRFLRKLAHFEGLITDDLGYVQQSREEMEVLFTLLAERYERGSVSSPAICRSPNGKEFSKIP